MSGQGSGSGGPRRSDLLAKGKAVVYETESPPDTDDECHNPIFTPGIFSGVGAQNGTARATPDQPNWDPSFQNDPRMLPRAPLPKFEKV